MDRRKLLKTLSIISASTIVRPAIMNFTKGTEKTVENNLAGFIEFHLSDLELFILSDGYVPVKNLQPIFAPGIKEEEVKSEMSQLLQRITDVEISLNILLIKKGKQLILIDTGSGPHFGESEGWLPNSLNNAGFSNQEITDIFLTHAHRDHLGGIVDKLGEFIFPNAKYYISQVEFNFWTAEQLDFSKSKISNYPEKGISFTKNILNKIKDNLNFYTSGEILFNCLKTELAEGHTPGHTIFSLFSKDKTLTHIVDIVHNQLLIENPKWGTQFDVDFNKAIESRIRILEKVSSENHLIISTHLPWPGVGHIIKINDGFKWIPIAYSTPKRIAL